MSTASSADESDASRHSFSYDIIKKRKNTKVESASAPKRQSERIASKSSDLTVDTSQLRLSSSLSPSYDLNNLAFGFGVNTDTTLIEANEKEKEWWAGKDSLDSSDIDEKRLPLVLARGVTFSQFEKRVEIINARRFLDYRNGTVTIIELPTGEHEAAQDELRSLFKSAVNNNTTQQDGVDGWGAKSLYTNLSTNEYEEPDACFVPRRLLDPLNPAQFPCDKNGNPWPTIIFEAAFTETIQHIKNKINNHWLAPNRCEDVIVIKIGTWSGRRHNKQTGRPLRRLLCQKYCRTATLQRNPNAITFDPIEEIEFGSVYVNGRESTFCTGPHMRWITIDCNCIYTGCPQPPPLPSFHAVISSRPFPQGPPQPQGFQPQGPPQPQGLQPQGLPQLQGPQLQGPPQPQGLQPQLQGLLQPQGPQPQPQGPPQPQLQGPQPQPQVPYPLQRPGVAIDLYDIQQAIFRAMGPK